MVVGVCNRIKLVCVGSQRGVEVAQEITLACADHHIETLTLFAFSSENKRRPYKEVQALLKIFSDAFFSDNLFELLKQHQICVRFIGERGFFDHNINDIFTKIESFTDTFERMKVNIAINYGGRWDITQAACKALESAPSPLPQDTYDWMDQTLAQHLLAPDVDLLVRTGRERRISNFLLWQSAYAEIYFSDTLWPDFSVQELEHILQWYANRERRFGHTSKQLQEN